MSQMPPPHRTVLLALVAALAACGGSGSGSAPGSSGAADGGVAISSVSPPESPASGGAEIALDGHGFAPGLRVLFGDVEAPSVAVESPTHAVAVAPRHAPGPVDLEVKDGHSHAQLPGAFRFDDAPVVAFVDPGHVPQEGGTVIVNGTGFRKGARVLFGADASVGDARRTSETQLVAVAGPHAPGAVDVTVVNPDGQQATLPAALRFDAPAPPPPPPVSAPSLASLSPATGPETGGTVVTLAGSSLDPLASVQFGGAPATVTAVTATSLTAVAPPHAPGAVDVVVTNPDGQQAALAAAFAYVALPPPPPALSSVAPSSGPDAGGTSVVLAGSAFQPGASVTFGGAPATVLAGTATSLTVLAPAHAAGAVDVVVSNPDAQQSTLAAAFSYVASAPPPPPPAAAPSIASVTPSSGPIAGGNTIVVSGSSFQPGAAVAVDGAPVAVSASSATSLSVTAPAHAAGVVGLTVTNPDGQVATLAAAYTFVAPAPPAVSAAAPTSGPDLGGTTVSLTGSGFAQGASVTFGGTAAAVVSGTASALTVTAPPHAAGAVDVVVTNPDGQRATLAGGYAYLPPPQLAAVAPASGPVAGGTLVTLAGSGFQPGATVAFGGVAGAGAVVGSASIAVATPPHASGAVDVVVTNPDGRTAALPGAFTFVAPPPPPPSIARVTPSSGTTLGGTSVVVAGAAFDAAATVSVGGAPAPVSARSATALTVATPAHAAGAADVTVTNGDGQSSTLAAAFTFVAPPPPPPSVASVSPSSGPTAGGTSLAVSGAGFQPGAAVSVGGVPAQVAASSATLLSVLAPPHAAGAADVTVTNPDGQAATLAAAYAYVAPPPPPPPPPPPAPSIASVTPSSGTTLGGTSVVVAGAAFDAAATVSIGGAPAPVSARSATALTVVAPAHAAGAADVTVTNGDGQSSTRAAAFTYVAPPPPPPSIAAVSPRSGTTLGGTSVVVTGAAFDAAASVSIGGAPAPVSARSATALTVATPAHAAGAADVTVRNGDGQSSTLAAAFTFVAPPPPPPSVAGVAPSSGSTAGGTALAVSGANFQPGAAVSVGGAAAQVTASSATLLSVLAPPHAAGAVAVTVTNPDGQAATLAAAYAYVAPPPPPPALLALSPLQGPDAGGTLVTLSGRGFQPGAAVAFGGAAAAVASVTASTLVALAPAHVAGAVDVTVTNPDGQASTLAGAFTFVAPPPPPPVLPAPALASVAPSSGPAAGGTAVVLSGAAFQAGAAVTLGGASAAVVSLSPTSIAIVAPPHAAGAVDVAVTNPDGQRVTLPAAFAYVAPPALASASPASGLTTGGASVVLSGSGFSAGAAVTFGGAAATVQSLSATAIAVVAPPHAAGAVDVGVTNPDGQAATLARAFTYLVPPPSIAALSPASGTTLGGTAVTVAGAGFQAGATASLGGSPASVGAVTATSLTLTTPAHAAGPAALVVTNPDGQSATLAAAFTYVAPPPPPPALASVTPAQGSTAGGATVTLAGSGFAAGATVAFGGATAIVVGATSTSISALTPAHLAGPADVTVTNPDGQSATLAAAFTFVAPPPPPVLASLLPSSGPAAGGTTVALSGASFQAGAAVSFGGVPAVVQSVSPSSIAAVAPAHAAGAVDVTVTNPDGLSVTLPAAFTYVAPPALVAAAPSSGLTPGGAAVTLTGSGFSAGATVTFGGVAAAVRSVAATAIAVTAPPHVAGAVDVVVVNPDGQRATLAAGFVYVVPPPAIASIAPTSGTTLGGTAVAVTGAGFQAGATATLGGAPAAVGAVGATSLTLTTPAHAAGPAALVVTNPDGQSATLAAAFTYVAPPPVLAAVAPAQGPDAGGTAVALAGSAFQAGATVSFGGVPAAVGAVTATSISATAPAHLAGPVAVTVTNPDGQASTLAAAFTYVAPPPPPTLASVVPSSGSTAGGTAVALSGAAFQAGASVAFGGLAATVVSSSPTALAVVAPAHAAGPVDVSVTNPDGRSTTLPAAFTYVAPPPPPPALAGISPVSGPAAGGTSVTLAGSGFASGARVAFGGAAATVTASSATSLSVTSPAHAAGAVDVVVTNPDGQSATLAAAFAYLAPPPPPALASATPASGPAAGGTAVVLGGAAFASGATVTFGGVAAAVTASSATSLSVTSPAHAAGAVNVVVTNPDGQASTLAGGFTYVAPPPPPALASVTPASGSTAGGTAVVLAGTGFASGATVTIGGAAATVGGVTATAVSVTTPAHAAGPADVVVTNPDGQASALAGGFTYVAPPPPPALAAVTPASGVATGGDLVTLAGTGFATGATVTFGGAAAVVTSGTATSLSVVTPAGASGAVVDVVVTNPDGQAATLAGAFTYVAPPPLGAPPIVASLTPTAGFNVGGTTVVITGKDFVNAIVWFGGLGGTAVAPFQASATSLSVLTPPHAAGLVDVVVQNADGQTATLPGAFTYVQVPVTPPPTLSGLSPASGPQNGNTVVTISGSGFVAGTTVTIAGVPAIMGAITATTITLTTPGGPAGPADVTVVNPDRQSATLAGGFTYVAPPPVVTAINVHGSPQAGGGLVLFAGTGLQNAVSVTFGGVPATGLTFDPLRNAITVVVPPSPLGPTADGFVNIVVTNADGQSTTWPSFHYGNPPAPTSFTPSTGPKGAPLTIFGTDFTADATGLRAGLQVSFGGVLATITAKTPTQIDVLVPKLNPGVYQVIVTNFDGQFAISPGTFTAPGP